MALTDGFEGEAGRAASNPKKGEEGEERSLGRNSFPSSSSSSGTKLSGEKGGMSRLVNGGN